jgi:hypothetical protein
MFNLITRSNLFTPGTLFFLCLLAIPFSTQAKQYGIALVDYSHAGYASAESDQQLERIADTGVEWINLVAPQMLDNIDSTAIYRSSENGMTPTDEALIHAINKAHLLGLKVMLYPHLELAHDPDHWFGEAGKNFSAAQWDEWFVSYTEFMSHYADLAASNGVEQLSLGMELMYAEKQEAHWRELIPIIRQRFSGTLIYAENYQTETYTSEISNVNWWDLLDYIGIDAYYDLVPEGKTNPTLEDMVEAWKPIVERLEKYSQKWNKPILIPELGYRSSHGSVHHPWDNPRGDVDLQEQANAYEAFYKSFTDKSWFAGVFWWAHSKNEPSSIENTSYSPMGKPAEAIIRQYLGSVDPGDCQSSYPLPQKNWRMISLPCEPPSNANTVDAVFGDDGLGVYDTDWVLYSYGQSKDVSDYKKETLSSKLEQGKGYWIISTAGDATLDLPKGSKQTPVSGAGNSAACQSDKGCFSIPIASSTTRTEWNLIGHPFLSTTAAGGLRIVTDNETSPHNCGDANGCTLAEAEEDGVFHAKFWSYQNADEGYSTITAADALDPWNGLWAAALVNAAAGNVQLLVPFGYTSNAPDQAVN